MRVEHLLDKGVGRLNEDAIVLGENRFGVFDGASSLDGYTDEQGKTGGYLAANIAKATFESSTAGLVETALEANWNIAEAMAASGINAAQKENAWCSTMAIVDLDVGNRKFEWIQIADTLILTIGKDGTYQMLVKDYDHDRGVLSLWKKLADEGVGDIRSRLQGDLIELRRTANVSAFPIS